MPQVPSFVIINDNGAAVRAQINQIIAALRSTSSGTVEPAATAPGMLWVDTSTTPPTLKIRNVADAAFEALLDGGEY
ncbi:hypothetical protein [Yoonia vestfoldensis]|uniref:Uncharacterized protein n=1 Tax=Yoonia vestfoldensis TaxID=245188 RepID=A0A1Y0EGL9_9RHOB|nr:hypothetical protein [Yoonia vestfoldensis]ARU02432.1 hypothetical protein LOKVESSMR4R_03149 [Yoonia vestfoldensis]